MKLVITDAAATDLEDIWLWIAADDPAGATGCIEKIWMQCQRLVDFPEMGRSRPDLASGVRALVYGASLIFYRLADDEVQVLRIVMGQRDLRDLFEE